MLLSAICQLTVKVEPLYLNTDAIIQPDVETMSVECGCSQKTALQSDLQHVVLPCCMHLHMIIYSRVIYADNELIDDALNLNLAWRSYKTSLNCSPK